MLIVEDEKNFVLWLFHSKMSQIFWDSKQNCPNQWRFRVSMWNQTLWHLPNLSLWKMEKSFKQRLSFQTLNLHQFWNKSSTLEQTKLALKKKISPVWFPD